MADQLFPVFDLPEIPDDPEYEERYRSSVAFDFDKGDFVRDGSNKMVRADGREAFMQWCWKVIQTEREAFLAYSDDIGTEFEDMEDFPDKDSREEVQRGVDMGNVAKIVVGVLAIGGTFFILLVREFGKFIDEVSPYNWGESEVLKDEYKR